MPCFLWSPQCAWTGITSRINCLHPNPCLRVYFLRAPVQDGTCLAHSWAEGLEGPVAAVCLSPRPVGTSLADFPSTRLRRPHSQSVGRSLTPLLAVLAYAVPFHSPRLPRWQEEAAGQKLNSFGLAPGAAAGGRLNPPVKWACRLSI